MQSRHKLKKEVSTCETKIGTSLLSQVGRLNLMEEINLRLNSSFKNLHYTFQDTLPFSGLAAAKPTLKYLTILSGSEHVQCEAKDSTPGLECPNHSVRLAKRFWCLYA